MKDFDHSIMHLAAHDSYAIALSAGSNAQTS
jgi:hypothetical protein